MTTPRELENILRDILEDFARDTIRGNEISNQDKIILNYGETKMKLDYLREIFFTRSDVISVEQEIINHYKPKFDDDVHLAAEHFKQHGNFDNFMEC